jgi:hypothetical protein
LISAGELFCGEARLLALKPDNADNAAMRDNFETIWAFMVPPIVAARPNVVLTNPGGKRKRRLP